MDVAERLGVALLLEHEVGPGRLEQAVRPVIGIGRNAVEVLGGEIELSRRVEDASERQVGQILKRANLGIGALLGDAQNLLEGFDGGLGVVLAHVGRTLEELGLHVEGALGTHHIEESDGFLELVLGVIELAEQKVKFVAHRRELRIVELGSVVLANLLENPGRVGNIAGQRRQPLQRLVVVRVGGPLLHDAIEVADGGRVEVQLVEGLAHLELGRLPAGFIATLILDGLVVLDGGHEIVVVSVELVAALDGVGAASAGQGCGNALSASAPRTGIDCRRAAVRRRLLLFRDGVGRDCHGNCKDEEQSATLFTAHEWTSQSGARQAETRRANDEVACNSESVSPI